MLPDINNDRKVSMWEGAAVDAWHTAERRRLGGGPSRQSSGCGNVAFGCALLLGFTVVLGVALVGCANLFV